jgi:spermidine synthase
VVVGGLFLLATPGEARLYSVEHFRAVRRSLRPGGVFCQWLAMYQLTPRELEIIAGTFQKVFPHTYFFCNTLDTQRPALALVGFQDDQELNWRTIAEGCDAAQKNSSLNQDPWLRNAASVAQLYLGEWKPPVSEDATAINTLGNLRIELDAGCEWITAGPGTRYLYGHRWLEFCEARRVEMAAEGLPMNSPVTLSSLEHANNLAREILRVQSQMQSR